MHFPAWIEKYPPPKRASHRLRHMLLTAAVHRYGTASIRRVAVDAQVDHSSICLAIKRGSFTPAMAESIERVFGRDLIPAEALVFPLKMGGSGNE